MSATEFIKHYSVKELGEKCAEYRKQNKILQSEIAEELGVSTETISAFEHGRTNNAVVLSWYIRHGLKL